jgi:hypothetical protein
MDVSKKHIENLKRKYQQY